MVGDPAGILGVEFFYLHSILFSFSPFLLYMYILLIISTVFYSVTPPPPLYTYTKLTKKKKKKKIIFDQGPLLLYLLVKIYQKFGKVW